MKKNEQKNIGNFQFSKIIIPVQYNNGSISEYHLLVDQDNLIHYYEVIWSKVLIQQTTTKSHQWNKMNDSVLIFRKNLLGSLHIEHLYGGISEKKLITLSSNQIKIMNDYFYSNWHKKTFQNIIYVLTGSHASGEGNPRSANAYTYIDGIKKSMSFFLQCLNISKEKYLFPIEEYQKLFNEIDKNRILEFHLWIDENFKLKKFFSIFNNYDKSNQWKNDVKKMKEAVSQFNTLKRELNCLVIKKRNIFVKKCKEKYQTIGDFWEIEYKRKPQYAHIKPVWKIRQQIIKKTDYYLLEQIADINNCIPLSPDIHDAYDKYEFYWDSKGVCKKFLDHNNEDVKDIDKYKSIPSDKLKNIQKYLIEYQIIVDEIINKISN